MTRLDFEPPKVVDIPFIKQGNIREYGICTSVPKSLHGHFSIVELYALLGSFKDG